MAKYFIEATDDYGRTVKVFLDGTREAALPGNGYTREEAVAVLEQLLWDLNDTLGLDLHG